MELVVVDIGTKIAYAAFEIRTRQYFESGQSERIPDLPNLMITTVLGAVAMFRAFTSLITTLVIRFDEV